MLEKMTEIDFSLIVGPIPTPAEIYEGADYPTNPTGVIAIGDNGFITKGTDRYQIVQADLAGVRRTVFDSDEEPAGLRPDDGVSHLGGPNRVLALFEGAEAIAGRIISVNGGTPHVTSTGTSRWAGATGRAFFITGPIDLNTDGSSWTPETAGGYANNNRWWGIQDGAAWMTSETQGYAVATVDRARWSPYDDENYLVSFSVNDDTEVAENSGVVQLLPPPSSYSELDMWLAGNAFGIGDGVFCVVDRIRPNQRTEQGYRPDVTYLRAYDYSGNLLAVQSEPMYTQTEDGNRIGTYGYSQSLPSADGTVVTQIGQKEGFAGTTPEGYGGYNMTTKTIVRRDRFTGSSWENVSTVLVHESDHTNYQDYVITFQEFQPGRFFMDTMRSSAPPNQYQVTTLDRVLTILDEDFNVVEEVVLPRPANGWWLDTNTGHEWSCFAPGNFGLVGWETYGDETTSFDNVGHALLIQHSAMIQPIMSANLKDVGQRFE